MVIPRYPLLALWAAATVATYYFVFFTRVGNYFHGGTPYEAMVVDTCAVLSSFFLVEVLRSGLNVGIRIAVGFLGAPIVLMVLLGLSSAIRMATSHAFGA